MKLVICLKYPGEVSDKILLAVKYPGEVRDVSDRILLACNCSYHNE